MGDEELGGLVAMIFDEEEDEEDLVEEELEEDERDKGCAKKSLRRALKALKL